MQLKVQYQLTQRIEHPKSQKREIVFGTKGPAAKLGKTRQH